MLLVKQWFLQSTSKLNFYLDSLILYVNVFFNVFSCIAWNDSIASLKASLLGGLVVRFLANKNLITPNMASILLTRVLQGLQLHGQHDSNQVLFKTGID